MIPPSVVSPVAAEMPAATSSRISSGLRSWRSENPEQRHRARRQHVRPVRGLATVASTVVSPDSDVCSCWSTRQPVAEQLATGRGLPVWRQLATGAVSLTGSG